MMAGKRVLVLVLLVLVGPGFGAWLSLDGHAVQAPVVRITGQGSNASVIDITVHGLETEAKDVAGRTYTVVRLPGEPAMTGNVGAPGLPQIVRNLGLPDGAQVSVQVLESQYRTFTGVLVYPAQKPLTDNDQESFTIDRAAYSADAEYPGAVAEVAYQTVWRGLPFANVVVSPIVYNAARQELRVYSHLRVRVSHPGIRARRQIEPWMAAVYQNNIDNFDQLGAEIAWNEDRGVRYLVITTPDYSGTWLDSLVNWHHRRGIETRVIAKSGWTDVAVRDSVAAEYGRSTPAVLRWVLLVGSEDEVPQHAYSGVDAADMWYGDIEPPSGDDYFELGVGRFCPADMADLANQIRKTLKFEKAPPLVPDWCSKVTLAAHSQNYPGKYSACTRGIYNYPYSYYQYTFDTIMGGTSGTNAMVVSDINAGRVVVNYRGHGSEVAWTDWAMGGGSWTESEIGALTNSDMTPVVINCCCLNHVLSAGTCLGESWMSKYPGGAVASLGAYEPSYTIPNHGWDSLLFRCLGDTYTHNVPGVRDYVCPVWDLGWMLCNADAYIRHYYSSQGGIDNARMYFWLGDPALNVWTGTPAAPTVDHPAVVPLGSFDFSVNVKRESEPVEDALVCAWKEGEFYATGHTDASGNVTLSIEATTPGEFSVTVTGQTLLPYEGTCLAHTSGTAFVIYRRSTVNDSPPGGNGDGSINPGETIILPTWVKNHGDSVGYSVVGKLRTGDPDVALLDSAKSFGDIAPNDSAFTGPSGFEFAVAPACTNGHQIHFVMQCRDANDSAWNSNIYLRVGAPFFVYSSLQAVDTLPGGNRNGRLDPEERAQLVVSVRNTGFGNAQDVSGVLRSGHARLVVEDSTGDFGTVPADSTGSNSADPFIVQALTMPPETPIPCTLEVSCGGNTWKLAFDIIVGELRATDPIPDGPRIPALYWAYDDSDTLYDQHPTYDWVEVNTVGTQIGFSQNDDVELINIPPAFGPVVFYGQEYTQLSVSADGWIACGNYTSSNYVNAALPGSAAPPAVICGNWDDLYPYSGGGGAGYVYCYHDTVNHRFVVEYDSVRYYSGSNRDKFEFVFYDTTMAAADGNSRILVQYMTANQTGSTTVGIQDESRTIGIQCLFNSSYHKGAAPLAPEHAILYTTDAATGVNEPRTDAGSAITKLSVAVNPNPSRRAANIHWQLPKPGPVQLRVYDVGGRCVRTLINEALPAGRHISAWDGRDDQGRTVANGLYLYRLQAGDRSLTAKAVLLH
jgi:hypothetical protein